MMFGADRPGAALPFGIREAMHVTVPLLVIFGTVGVYHSMYRRAHGADIKN
jgi:hypothetical protein